MTRYITTRPVTFGITDRRTRASIDREIFPTGTEVTVVRERGGVIEVRVAGTLYTQRVYPAAIAAA